MCPMARFRSLLAVGLACTACSADHGTPADPPPDAGGTAGCIAGGGGFLHARLRGAVIADLDWNNADMQCDGGPRPDDKGMRLTFAGRLQGTAHQLRFIFGIDEQDIAAGAAQVMPTNLTVILEGEQRLFATRGSEHCAVETLERRALEQTGNKRYRVHARGFCTGPATNVAGDERLLVPTFEFTGTAAAELE
jgi:hypothetical protein